MKHGSIYKQVWLILLLFVLSSNTHAQNVSSQDRDKVSADVTLYEMLCANHTPSAPTKVMVLARELEKTYEQDLYRKKGTHYQIMSLTNDFYVFKKHNDYQVVFEQKYPVESFINLMLNLVASDKVMIAINQHMYGEKKTVPPIPIGNLHDLFNSTMDTYCSVTKIEKGVMNAIIVFHHRKMDFIHMLTLSATPEQLFSENAVIKADLYGNIPQSNIKNLFNKYR